MNINGWTQQDDVYDRVNIGGFIYGVSLPIWTKDNRFIRIVRHRDYDGWAVQRGRIYRTKYGLDYKVTKEHRVHDKNAGIKIAGLYMQGAKFAWLKQDR